MRTPWAMVRKFYDVEAEWHRTFKTPFRWSGKGLSLLAAVFTLPWAYAEGHRWPCRLAILAVGLPLAVAWQILVTPVLFVLLLIEILMDGVA